MAILDSSVIIELLRGNEKIIREVEKLNERLNTTLINFYEVVRGVKGKKREKVINFFKEMDLYPLDLEASMRAIRIYDELKSKGAMINELDILIASISMVRNEILITLDQDFKQISYLKLRILEK
ncbi:MAG: type II toxin-antitoxin system VapC family toxin [Sulfolobus sp.]|nr:type II toxin-antitoxin system VapC family toxin [Sulfolobus sp.]